MNIEERIIAQRHLMIIKEHLKLLGPLAQPIYKRKPILDDVETFMCWIEAVGLTSGSDSPRS